VRRNRNEDPCQDPRDARCRRETRCQRIDLRGTPAGAEIAAMDGPPRIREEVTTTRHDPQVVLRTATQEGQCRPQGVLVTRSEATAIHVVADLRWGLTAVDHEVVERRWDRTAHRVVAEPRWDLMVAHTGEALRVTVLREAEVRCLRLHITAAVVVVAA
jgi:hypothetical protein